MILDGLLLFSSGATYGAGTLAIADSITTGTTNSTNTIDLGPGPTNTALPPSQTSPNVQPFRDIGIGDDPAMKLLVQCLTTFQAGTSLLVGLQGAQDNGSGIPGSFTTWWQAAAATPLANLTAGARLLDMDMPRPPAGVPEPRFLRLVYTAAGTFSPAGLLLATIVLDRHDQVYNASANNVLGGYPAGITVAN
jgi:hypothetical protein